MICPHCGKETDGTPKKVEINEPIASLNNEDIRMARGIGRAAAQMKLPREAIGNPDLMPILRKYTKVQELIFITKAFYEGYDKEGNHEDHSDNKQFYSLADEADAEAGRV